MKNIKGVKMETDMPAKQERMLPSFTITSADLPEIKDWKVGNSYYLKIKVEQVSLGKGEHEYMMSGEKGKTMHARFQMKGIEAIKENKKEYSEEYAERRSKAPRA